MFNVFVRTVTVLRSNSHPTSTNDKAGLVPPLHSLSTCVPLPHFDQILTRRHRTARRNWCCRYLHFERADWDLILFFDACVIELGRFGGGSVLVCGGILGGNKTRLIDINGNINAQTYINDVFAMEALPFIQFHGPNVNFMHDNARPHSAAITRQILATYK